MSDMELSPIAREKLARAGELSAAEKEKMKAAEALTVIMSDFFTQKIDHEGLWKELKKLKDEGKEALVKETQSRLLNTLTLGTGDADIERYCSGILSLETLKEPGRYADLEYGLNTFKKLRQQYLKEKNEKFASIKDGIRPQVKMAVQKMAAQTPRNAPPPVDIESTIEATARNTPQWREFSISYEKNYNKKFEELLTKLKQLI
jgi:hypothetical protein